MTPEEVAEYTELRATIRQRGTARIWVFVVTLVAWAGATVATAALAALPVATLLPLLLLAAGVQATFQLHTGIERIGRYLQVFYEDPEHLTRPAWENAAMAYGRAHPTRGFDPLFTPYVLGAVLLNFIPVMLAEPVMLEIAVVGAVHLLLVARLFVCRHHAGRQRGIDLERFRQIKEGRTHVA